MHPTDYPSSMPSRLRSHTFSRPFSCQPYTNINQVQDDTASDDDPGGAPVCGECGHTLSPGWFYESCRRACPYCNRALGSDPNDYCTRCYRKCDRHNIVYSLVSLQPNVPVGQCPECAKTNTEKFTL